MQLVCGPAQRRHSESFRLRSEMASDRRNARFSKLWLPLVFFITSCLLFRRIMLEHGQSSESHWSGKSRGRANGYIRTLPGNSAPGCPASSGCEAIVRNEFRTDSCQFDIQKPNCTCVMDLLGLNLCAEPSTPALDALYKYAKSQDNAINLGNISSLAQQMKINPSSLPTDIGSLGSQIVGAAGYSPDALNNFFFPPGSVFASNPNATPVTIIVYISDAGDEFVFDGSIINGKQNFQPYTKYTQSCYKYLQDNGNIGCSIYDVTPSSYKITILDLFFAGAASIFDVLNFLVLFVLLCCKPSSCCCCSVDKLETIKEWKNGFLVVSHSRVVLNIHTHRAT